MRSDETIHIIDNRAYANAQAAGLAKLSDDDDCLLGVGAGAAYRYYRADAVAGDPEGPLALYRRRDKAGLRAWLTARLERVARGGR